MIYDYQTRTVEKWLAYFGLRDIPVCTLAEEPGKEEKKRSLHRQTNLFRLNTSQGFCFFSPVIAFASILKTGQNKDREQEMKNIRYRVSSLSATYGLNCHFDVIFFLSLSVGVWEER